MAIKEDYPFARSLADLEEDHVGKPTELPFVSPEAAEAALRKMELERLVWRHACEAMAGDDWECRGRPEGALDWRIIPAKLLPRAIPNFGAGSFVLLGELYQDVEFLRTSPVSPDERALEVIRRFCEKHDPGSHIVADVIQAIDSEASLRMSDGHVRRLMNKANLDNRWFAPGRRSARCTACKP